MSYDAYLAINASPYLRRMGMDDLLPKASIVTASQVYATVISHDNQYLALGIYNQPYLEIYDMASETKIDNVPSLPYYVNGPCLAFSPDGKRLYCGLYASPFLTIVNLETFGIISSGITLPSFPTGLSLSPDGKRLIFYFSNNTYPVVIDTDSMTVVDTNNVFPVYIYGGAFNEDGSVFYVSTTVSPYLRVIRTADWTQISSTNNVPTYSSLEFASGYLFCRRTNGAGFGVFDSSLNEVPEATALITRQIMAMKASPDGRYMLFFFTSNTYPKAVRLRIGDWRIEPVDALSLATFGVNDIAISRPEFKRIYGTVRDKDGNPAQRTVRIFHRGNGRMVAEQQSDATTGDYEASVVAGEYDVVAMAADGENLNDLIYARVTPE